MSEDYLRSSSGLRRIDTNKQHLWDLYNPTIRIDYLPPDAIQDPGDFATMRHSANVHLSSAKLFTWILCSVPRLLLAMYTMDLFFLIVSVI